MWCRTSAESSRPIIPPLTPNQQTFTWEQPLDLPVWLLEQDPVPSFAVRLTPTIEKTVGDNRKDRQNVKGYVLPLKKSGPASQSFWNGQQLTRETTTRTSMKEGLTKHDDKVTPQSTKLILTSVVKRTHHYPTGQPGYWPPPPGSKWK
jgi:hypothetical protein